MTPYWVACVCDLTGQGAFRPVRTSVGRVSVRVSRITECITLDGTLGEPVYGPMPPFPGFVQREPNEGAPATEKTQA